MLTTSEARQRLLQYGPNVIPQKRRFSAAGIFLHQFASPLIFVLLAAGGITLFLGDFVDTAVIGAAVGVNTIVGFLQEYKAQRALAALKTILTPQAKVIRDGEVKTIPARELVVGDTVLLSPGDRVPADGRVVEAVRLFVNEAILTGESAPIEKNDGDGSVFMGTTVAGGRAKMVVTATGVLTRIGRMAIDLEATKKEETPLQRQIAQLARKLAVLVTILSALVVILGVAYGEDAVTMLTTGVAIAVSAVPEGLAVSLTVILAFGMQRVMRRNALVRRMLAAETLGSVSTICVDKTGTITEGVMQVVKEAYGKSGELGKYGRIKDLAIRAAIFANNLEDPLELAVWDWAREQDHVDPQAIVDQNPRRDEAPFDSSRKYMAVTTEEGVWVKGAPEVVLGMSKITLRQRGAWMKRVEEWGKDGLRVIALSYNKTFLGLLGIADPVREGVREAVAHVRNAGVAVTMVTGDYRATAEAVLRSIGIPITQPDREIMEGSELAAIDADELTRRVRDVRLFCRVSPDQKHKIVAAFQRAGEVVAMTGDGVNDAMAIKRADIGIVVAGASDAARQTADLVLLDSHFMTIVAAIEEGRAMFERIRKVTLYLLSNAFVEIMVVTGGIILGLPIPLTAIQILWINLVDDGLPAIALTVDPKSHDLMRRSPRAKGAVIVDGRLWERIVLVSVATAAIAIASFFWAGGGEDLPASRTMVFTLVAVVTMLYAFACRSIDRPLNPLAALRNPWLTIAAAAGLLLQAFAVYHPWGNHVFGTTALSATAWVLILGASIGIGILMEGVKRLNKVTN